MCTAGCGVFGMGSRLVARRFVGKTMPNRTQNQLRWNYPLIYERKSILRNEILVQKTSFFEHLQFTPGGNDRENVLSMSFEWVADESCEHWEQLIHDTFMPHETHFPCYFPPIFPYQLLRSLNINLISVRTTSTTIRTSLIHVDRRYCCCSQSCRLSWWWCHWFIGHQFTNSKRIFSGNSHFAETDGCHITICIEWTRACVFVTFSLRPSQMPSDGRAVMAQHAKTLFPSFPIWASIEIVL